MSELLDDRVIHNKRPAGEPRIQPQPQAMTDAATAKDAALEALRAVLAAQPDGDDPNQCCPVCGLVLASKDHAESKCIVQFALGVGVHRITELAAAGYRLVPAAPPEPAALEALPPERLPTGNKVYDAEAAAFNEGRAAVLVHLNAMHSVLKRLVEQIDLMKLPVKPYLDEARAALAALAAPAATREEGQ
jgi:hypothetical protein